MAKKPVLLCIMDGFGWVPGETYGNAVVAAKTPHLDALMAKYPMTTIEASGMAVGLPDGQMGNSEVGHNALGCGQIYSQGAKLVQESIETGSLYQSKTWVDLTDNCLQNGKALHFIGLLSDGNVHSNISHLIAMLKKAREMGLKRVYCHILLDGRDVPATSALDYVDQLETVLAELNDAEHEYKIASGGELARIMLAMKNVLSEQDHVGTMVFDEVDTGVSGRAAQKVAEKMARISRRKQVLCVTHLPQLAAMADTHFSVEKGERDGRTYTEVRRLDREQRRRELARLTGGSHVSQTMLDGAEELLVQAEKFRAEL